uniref:Uncharacterized protein n=1 Tax=Romanomermis culicivorax TaxID=13658 RepID=A0A915IFN1_ROMCU
MSDVIIIRDTTFDKTDEVIQENAVRIVCLGIPYHAILLIPWHDKSGIFCEDPQFTYGTNFLVTPYSNERTLYHLLNNNN